MIKMEKIDGTRSAMLLDTLTILQNNKFENAADIESCKKLLEDMFSRYGILQQTYTLYSMSFIDEIEFSKDPGKLHTKITQILACANNDEFNIYELPYIMYGIFRKFAML